MHLCGQLYHPSGQIEQGAHYIRKSLIYLKKAFLERAVVELVYKFNELSYHECLKSELIAKVRFEIFFCPRTYIYTQQPRSHIPPLALRVRGK